MHIINSRRSKRTFNGKREEVSHKPLTTYDPLAATITSKTKYNAAIANIYFENGINIVSHNIYVYLIIRPGPRQSYGFCSKNERQSLETNTSIVSTK